MNGGLKQKHNLKNFSAGEAVAPFVAFFCFKKDRLCSLFFSYFWQGFIANWSYQKFSLL